MHKASTVVSIALALVGGASARFAEAAPIGAAPVERLALVFGQHIRYVEAGEGPTVLLVHGLGDDAGVWQAELPQLARRHHVIALDQIGFGRSDKPLLNYRVETLVDFLDEFMSTMHVTHASIVGNSLGGWVAALLAIEHPRRVERLVLVDAAGLSGLTQSLGPRLLNALRLATIQDLEMLGPLTFADARYYHPLTRAFAERVAAGDSYAVGHIVDAMERHEDVLDGRLGGIVIPTLIVWGRLDGLIPLRFAELLRDSIRGAHLTVLEHCAHEPQVECPEAFEATIESFLAADKNEMP